MTYILIKLKVYEHQVSGINVEFSVYLLLLGQLVFTNSSTCFFSHLSSWPLFLEQLKLIFQLFLLSHERLEHNQAWSQISPWLQISFLTLLSNQINHNYDSSTKNHLHKNNSSKTTYSSEQSKFVSQLLIISSEVTATREW